MRRFLLATSCLVAAIASAQEPVPDLTPPHLYFPLAVGDVREYVECVESFGPTCFRYEQTRREMVGDTLIDGVRYVVETTWALDAGYWTDVRETRLLRFDTTSALGVMRQPDGTERPVTCGLDAPFGSFDEVCGLPVEELAPGRKYFGAADAGWVYEAGVGFVETIAGFYDFGMRLTYWDVAGVEGGAAYPVTAVRRPEAGALAVAAFPNPSAGPLAVVVDLPRAADVTLDAFDALGRRVWSEALRLGAEAGRVEVDASGWAPGLYVVRATSGGEIATATVVRR